jgi:hypothetical protein
MDHVAIRAYQQHSWISEHILSVYVNVSCVMLHSQAPDSFTFVGHRTCDICLQFLKNELSDLLRAARLETWTRMHFQHDSVLPYFSWATKIYPYYHFPDGWVSRGGSQHWLPRPPVLNSHRILCVWTHARFDVGAKVLTCEVLQLCRILEPTTGIKRSSNEMKRPATHTLARRRASMCTEVEGGHFEHLL